jgi:hypothetical protein
VSDMTALNKRASQHVNKYTSTIALRRQGPIPAHGLVLPCKLRVWLLAPGSWWPFIRRVAESWAAYCHMGLVNACSKPLHGVRWHAFIAWRGIKIGQLALWCTHAHET